VENLKASGIRKAAAGIEPLPRCDLESVVLSSVSVQYKRAEIIHMRKSVAYHIKPFKDEAQTAVFNSYPTNVENRVS
jgi:hypothetical protein